MYEMGAVEVSRNFRHMNIAQKMISLILADDFFEDQDCLHERLLLALGP